MIVKVGDLIRAKMSGIEFKNGDIFKVLTVFDVPDGGKSSGRQISQAQVMNVKTLRLIPSKWFMHDDMFELAPLPVTDEERKVAEGLRPHGDLESFVFRNT